MGDAAGAAPVRVLHVSDIHCGHPFVADHVAAAEAVAQLAPLSAIAVSGDLSQRARTQEFREARLVLDRFEAIAPTIVVPGNHDAAWWHAPFGRGDYGRVHENFRKFIQPDLEPVLRVPGVSLVGLNSAAGMMPHALTWYPRDWRVKGGLTNEQLSRAAAQLATSPSGDLRILVVHHNVLRGRLSGRWGLTHPEAMLDAITAMPVEVVCNGHDHEERLEVVTRAARRILVSTANTLSSRMRGRRASALNVIERLPDGVRGTSWGYDAATRAFIPAFTSVWLPIDPRPTTSVPR